MRHRLSAAALAAAAVAGTLSAASPANAAPAPAPVEAAAAAPSCFTYIDYGIVSPSQWIRYRNDCAYTYTVRLDVRLLPDPSCQTVSPGEIVRFSWSVATGHRGLVLC
jgi:hypothetical protein